MFIRVALWAVFAFVGVSANAVTYTIYHEGDPPGQTTFNTNLYGDYLSLVNNSPFASDTAAVTHGTGVSVGGMAWNGSQYVVLRESDPGGLNNLNFATYDSYSDLRNNNFSSANSASVQWGSGVSARGLAHDGERYILMLESDPGGLGNINLVYYDTYFDLITNNFSGSTFWGQNIWGSGVSAVGLAHDGSQYLLMLESDPGGLGNYNIVRYDTFADLMARNFSGSSYLGQNIFGTTRSVGGLAGIADPVQDDPGDPPIDPAPVPLPASVFGLLCGLALLPALGRRRTKH